MNKKEKKLWGGRFEEETSSITEKMSSSIHFDARLYKQDIKGSIAHARMLEKAGLLTGVELKAITGGLKEIEQEIESNNFVFSSSLEDIHMNIESRLTEKIGDAGRKLHTARSRNDQIALDGTLYIRDESDKIQKLLHQLIHCLQNLAQKHIDVIMPGYTHLQVAQPIRLGHHLLAHAWALLRDMRRLQFVTESCSVLPLGAGALSGVNYLTDRDFLKEELGFDDITHNSMDTVSNRDFVLDFIFFASTTGMHLSRFCEEIILWSSSEFNFITLGDNVTTGSSIMPQKRNPDIAELIRGKTGRLYGNLISLLTTLKGLPLAYNRDMQEDKEPLFDSVDTIKLSLEGMHEMLKSITVNIDSMRNAVYKNYSTATDLADYLAHKGVPFRDAHEIIGNIVSHCEKNRIDFFGLTTKNLKKFSSHFDDDVTDYLNPETSTDRKVSAGSTSKESIQKQISLITEQLAQYNK